MDDNTIKSDKELTCGERVKKIRKTLSLTLEKFGNSLGVTKTAISNIENSNRNVTDQMSKLICREFKVNEDWLKTGEGEMFQEHLDEIGYYVEDLLEYDGEGNPLYDMIVEMMKKYQALDDKSKKIIRDYFGEVMENMAKKKKN